MTSTSDTYRIAPPKLAALMARRWLWRWWWAFVLPVAAAAVAALYDVRFVYVALMLVFIVWPMALVMVWLGVCTTPSVAMGSLPARTSVTQQGVETEYFGPDDTEYISPRYKRGIIFADMKNAETDGDFLVITPKGSRRLSDLVVVPKHAIADRSLAYILDLTSDNYTL